VPAQEDATEKSAAAPRSYRALIVPFASPDLLPELIRPAEEFVERESGLEIDVHVCATYRACVQKITADEFDMGFLSGPAAARALASKNVVPLVREVSDNPTILFTTKSTKVTDASQLLGQPIAMTDPLSNSSSVQMQLLEAVGTESEIEAQLYHPGSATHVIVDVLEGRARAGLIEFADLARLTPEIREQIVILAKARPSIRSVIVVSSSLPKATREKIRHAWMAFGNSDEGKQYFRDRPPVTYRPVTRDDLSKLGALRGPLPAGAFP